MRELIVTLALGLQLSYEQRIREERKSQMGLSDENKIL